MKEPKRCKTGERLAQRATRATLNIHILPTATAKARQNWGRHFKRCKRCQRWHEYKDRLFRIGREL